MTATPETPAEIDWVTRLADEVIEAAGELAPGEKIVCASGISPSGPIHLGNFRELMTPHLVADEIKRRGLACEHILSWDDYDRIAASELGGALQGTAPRGHGGLRHRGDGAVSDDQVHRR